MQLTKHGSLGNMKWLHEKGCPWGEKTFSVAAKRNDVSTKSS